MSNISFAGHFSSIGWTIERNSTELLWFSGKQLEAIKLQGKECVCSCSVLNEKNETWQKADKDGVAGTVGQKKSIYAIIFECDETHDVYYRVCLKNGGWTPFYSNGEVCGNKESCIEGIQIFLKLKEERLDEYITEAERKLFQYQKIRKQLFIDDADKMLLACTKDYHFSKEIGVQEIANGYILPLKKLDQGTRDGIYAGGVCDAQGNFVTGFDRKNGVKFNLCCLESYSFVENEAVESEQSVIFGGIYIKHFGHLFVECLSRLWYVIENSDDKDPIAILTIPGQEGFARDFFELLGIDCTRIMLVTQLTRFSKIKVPDQTINLWAGYFDKYVSIYDKMRENVTPAHDKKIFLTRTSFGKSDSVNEEWFDSFFERHGYKIIAPETHPIKEQVSIIAGADEIICTEGTLSHLVLFAKPGTRLVIFRRDHKIILLPQLILNQVRQVDVTYVDATCNFLPTKHAHGCYLYGPTKHFVDFIKASGLKFSDEEVQFDLQKYVYEYLLAWCKNYNVVNNFNDISEVDLFDIIERMNRVFGMNPISRSKYVTKVKAKEKKLQDENKRLKKQLEAKK